MAPERRCFEISTRDDAPSHRPRLAMNSPQAKLKRARAAEVQEATDLKKFKSDLLAKSIIKSITKEQTTDRSVSALQFNHVPGSNCGNLFATCAADFATVYDDEHFGDHIALVVQFKNEKTAHVAGGDLAALAWLDARGFSNHEFGDALLAVGGGDDNVVQVISIAEGRVIKLLKGHGGRILALAAGYAVAPSGDAPSRPETVVVLSSDGVATRGRARGDQSGGARVPRRHLPRAHPRRHACLHRTQGWIRSRVERSRRAPRRRTPIAAPRVGELGERSSISKARTRAFPSTARVSFPADLRVRRDW